MSVFVGQKAPNFNGLALMPDNTLNTKFNFGDYIHEKMGVLFFYAMNFAYVDPTELVALNNRIKDFENRNVRVVAINTETHLAHLNWKQMALEKGGIGDVQFPIVADITKKISQAYGVLVNEAVSLRATFLIDRAGYIRNQSVYDFPIGRNIDETLRIIDAHKHYEKTGRVCPANWQSGDAGLAANENELAEFMQNYAQTV